MKKILAGAIIAIVALFPLSGCRKLVDHIFHHGNNAATDCRITKIIQSGENGEVITGTVYYNDHNDPDSVIFDFEGGSAGGALFYFKYDDHHRLIEYREDYSRQPDDYYHKHNYVYADGIIVTDTARIREAGQWAEVRNLEYDVSGRVIKENRHIIELDYLPADEVANPFEYIYNAFGNLDGDIFVYDNKVNFLRTNKVWMFTQRNYSTNNRPGATSYNEYGLPLTFKNGSSPAFLIFGGPTSIEYHCSAK